MTKDLIPVGARVRILAPGRFQDRIAHVVVSREDAVLVAMADEPGAMTVGFERAEVEEA